MEKDILKALKYLELFVIEYEDNSIQEGFKLIKMPKKKWETFKTILKNQKTNKEFERGRTQGRWK